MDFQLTDDQIARNDHLGRFAAEILSAGAAERIRDARFDRTKWDAAAEMGLAGLPVDADWGGLGFGALDTMLTIEALGRKCADLGLVFSLCAHMFACVVPVWRHGSLQIREKWLRDMASGRVIAANAMTEAESGSDAFAMRASAQRDGDDYVLTGSKCFITNAPIADVFVAYAKTNPRQGFFGISCFIVPRDAPGLTVQPEARKSGLPTSPWGSVYFDACRIPAANLLGAEGAGAAIFHDSMIWERGCLFAAYVGAMERVLKQCVEHARDRRQFGKPIGRNQSVSDKLVDMKLRLETARLLLYRTGWLHDAGLPHEEASALSKLWISESAVKAGLDAIQLFGASAAIADNGLDRLLLDSLPSRLFSGSSEIQREIVARHMGLR
ncbi:acyl-CoA dehydrogenase family protein [Methylocystis sp. JR02]|uniref:acyl-CoA dehydrogenase family protein n=1 Tax=Methylocystis sp. JR02 TaxID=3046284 RepID=UPI0024BABBE2|nr:acyl-CoA dehydrogenase family protein [Methylocystis sp. JR02]MDJ0450859.1 acyl-CoA dehydrogenase family protein [Methylocystis sp. JR02]